MWFAQNTIHHVTQNADWSTNCFNCHQNKLYQFLDGSGCPNVIQETSKRAWRSTKCLDKWAVRTVQGTEASGYSLPLFLYGLLIACVAKHGCYTCRLPQSLSQGAVGQSAISFKVRDVQFAQLQSFSPIHGSMVVPWLAIYKRAQSDVFVSDVECVLTFCRHPSTWLPWQNLIN